MARDSRDKQLIELKDTVKELTRTTRNLTALLEAAQKRDEEYRKQEEEFRKRDEEHLKREQVLQEQIDYLTKKLFGKSSEKRDDQKDHPKREIRQPSKREGLS